MKAHPGARPSTTLELGDADMTEELGEVMTDTKELDPLIVNLFNRLPESGSVWSDDDRANWLSSVEGIFEIVYEVDLNSPNAHSCAHCKKLFRVGRNGRSRRARFCSQECSIVYHNGKFTAKRKAQA